MNDEDLTENDICNYSFFIKGFISEIDKAFYKIDRSYGKDYIDALNRTYNKIYNELKNKYNLFLDTAIVIDYKILQMDNKDKGSGYSFYPLEDDIDEYNYLMSNNTNI